MNVAIIGAGLQGHRRAGALAASRSARITHVVSQHLESASLLCERFGGQPSVDALPVIESADVDVVLVCTPPDSHSALTVAALQAGKHVLCEKPLARTAQAAWSMVDTSRATGRVLHCGFNHRFHPAVVDLAARIASGEVGTPLVLRCAYGIGGREGYEKEWRADPRVVSGGQLMEQGIHAVDLARWMAGEVLEVTGAVDTRLWPIAPLEDNAVALLRHRGGAITTIHSSLTQWINLFRFEVVCERSVLSVEGLGASYGDEQLRVQDRTTGRFATHATHYRGGDPSWLSEWRHFVAKIESGTRDQGSAADGARAVEIVETVYAAARAHSWLATPERRGGTGVDVDSPGEADDLRRVLRIVRDHCTTPELGPDDALFTSGRLRSPDLVAIVALLEEAFDITVTPADMRTANFDTARAMTGLVRRLRG